MAQNSRLTGAEGGYLYVADFNAMTTIIHIMFGGGRGGAIVRDTVVFRRWVRLRTGEERKLKVMLNSSTELYVYIHCV
jgi:hypothetical protein